MPRLVHVLLILLIAAPFSGCLSVDGPGDGDADGGAGGDDRDGPFDLDVPFTTFNNATGCQLAVAVLLVDMGTVQDALPANFTARDAQGLLGTPAATGDGAVLVSIFSCGTTELMPEGWTGSEVNLYVQPPTVEGDRPATDHDYYQATAVAGDDAVGRLLDAYDWSHASGEASLDLQVLPTGTTTANAEATDGEGTLWSSDLTAAAANPFVGLSRFWQEVPTGIAYFDYRIDTDVLVGSASCDLRAGSAPAAAAGRTACQPGDVGIVAPQMDWVSSFRYLPGVHAA